MATKKISKKPAKAVKMLPFNKANAKLFADNIFSDKYGRVTFLKLCDGKLSNGKDGGRTLHCALGEAYFTFVDTNVAKFVKDIVKKFGDDIHHNHELYSEENRFNTKYVETLSGYNGLNYTTHIPTLATVDALVDVAQLRSKDPKVKRQLAQALLDTMKSNDETCGTSISEAAERSENVAVLWRERVVPLLK